jgi:hypothetical protein
LSRFQLKTTLPRFRACSVSSAGRLRVAFGAFSPASAWRIGSGHPVVTEASGTLMNSPEAGVADVAAGDGPGAAGLG